MKWLGKTPLHTLLLLSETPRDWAPWQVAPLPLVMAASAGLVWGARTGVGAWGWAVGLGLLAFTLADWGLLALLPRRGLSFGEVQPPILGLSLLRGLIALAAVLPAGRWPVATLGALLLVQAAICALMAYGTLVEPFRVQVTRLVLPAAKLANRGSPLRLVQVSDLHVERLSPRERALPALVVELQPDLLLLTGDFLSTSYQDDPRALADLRALLAQFHAPAGIYAVWGTAEVDLPDFLRPTLLELGIRVLEDEAVQVAVGGHHVWVMGLRCTRDLAVAGATLHALLAQAPADAFTLLLYHTPDLMPQAADLGVDLYLAGHTHGGQWRVPGFGAILTSSRYWKRYEAGHYRDGSSHLYVSRGLGMEGYGAPRSRFFCPPEVVSVTVSGARAGE